MCSILNLVQRYQTGLTSITFERFDRQVAIGVDANIGGNCHGLASNGFGILIAIHHAAGRGEGIVAARPDGRHIMLWLQNVACTCDHQKRIAIGDDQHRFQLLQVFVGTPILCQFHTGAGQLTGCRFQLAFQPLQQGERISRRTSKPRDHVKSAGRQPPHFARSALDHRLTKRDLSVARNHDLAVLFDTDDRGPVPAGEIGF
mmetsp:Transcript_18531/g.30380  ORF Transcript_18531/g.30380 Transcript_18531/m.30380 type:complete len:202 (+) Transcript_18531:1007-1612(+)